MRHTRRNRRFTRRRRTGKSSYRPRRYLLTRNEAKFHRVLTAVLGAEYQISCKVRLADIITCSNRDWLRGAANRIAQKHVDFLVTRVASSRIVAAIELDDSSHRRANRRLRDAFVNNLFRRTRIRLIRVPASWSYDVESVVAHLLAAGLARQPIHR